MRATNDVRKLLAWLEGAPVPEAQIVAAGFNHTLAISITPSREGADAEFRRVESPKQRANNHRNTLPGC